MLPRILIVDDEAPTRELVSLHLRKRGFDVTAARMVCEAREYLESSEFDLAILDIDLAGENGLDLLLHARRVRPTLPVIMFTGLHIDEDLLQEAKSRGAHGCMSKLQPMSDLAAEVHRLTKKQQGEAPNEQAGGQKTGQ